MNHPTRLKEMICSLQIYRCVWQCFATCNHVLIVALSLSLLISTFAVAGPVVRIPVTSQQQVDQILFFRGDILCGSTHDSLLVEFPSKIFYESFQERWYGNSPQMVADDLSQLLGQVTPTADELDDYHTYATAAVAVLNFVQNHPTIAKVDTFGYSRQNRAMLHLKISDSVDIDRDVPRVYMLAGTHGNEIISVEVILRYLAWLDTAIATGDTMVARHLEQTELHIIPIQNPDGYEARSRYNAANVDLNRNFPFHWSWAATNYGPHALSEPEDIKLDSLVATFLPVVSLNYHSYGGEVLRPYSYYTREPPDSMVLRNVSTLYHQFIPNYVAEMGSYLYWHGGEHNDWNYTQRGNLGLTIELWNGPDYNPPVAQIDSVVRPHFSGINTIIERALGNQITGIIRDSISLAPISNARWHNVSQWDTGFVDRKVLPNGRYRTLRQPGPVTLRFSAPNYQSKTFTVNVGATGPTVFDVVLQSSHCALAGTVDIVNRRPNDTITASIQYQTVVVDTSGHFAFDSLSTQPDTVVISGFNYEPLYLPVTLASMETTMVHGWTLRMLPPVVTFSATLQGLTMIFWRCPYTDSLTRSQIVGYAVWRDGQDYIPLTYDSSFVEPISPNDPSRIYRLQTIYQNGASILGDTVLLTPIEKFSDPPIVMGYGIGHAYPNPFNATVSIPYRLRLKQQATITVVDRLGRTVKSAVLSPGSSGMWHWSPGLERCAGGLYFLRIQMNGAIDTRKIVYLP